MAVATLIGDVVASRGAYDRAALHAALTGALERINVDLRPSTPLRVTVGDEYQGCFATLGDALRATLLLRVGLGTDAAAVDVRHGVGWGEVTILSRRPRVEDGPGWWAAREAIEAVAHAQTRAASRSLRTAYRGPGPAAVNAALVGRDQLLAGLDARSLSVLDGMLRGMSQQQIAQHLGVTPSAVSQRVRRDGLAAVVTIDELFGQLEGPS
jgi:hypothetical protein